MMEVLNCRKTARAGAAALLQVCGIGAFVKHNERIGQQHDDAFEGENPNANVLVRERERQHLCRTISAGRARGERAKKVERTERSDIRTTKSWMALTKKRRPIM